jgi:hypothetical protein
MAGYTQEGYWGALADPVKLRQYLSDWANGGAATHGVAGANNVGQSSYEQVLADLASRGIDIGGLAQHVSAPTQTTGPGLSPGYETNYQDQLRQLQLTRDSDSAMNEYARGLSAQQGARSLSDLGNAWDRKRSQLPGDFIRRGVYGTGASTSGIYQDALSKFSTQRATDTQNLNDQNNAALRQYDVNAANIGNAYNNSQLSLKAKREADIQSQAAALQGAKPFTV